MNETQRRRQQLGYWLSAVEHYNAECKVLRNRGALLAKERNELLLWAKIENLLQRPNVVNTMLDRVVIPVRKKQTVLSFIEGEVV